MFGTLKGLPSRRLDPQTPSQKVFGRLGKMSRFCFTKIMAPQMFSTHGNKIPDKPIYFGSTPISRMQSWQIKVDRILKFFFSGYWMRWLLVCKNMPLQLSKQRCQLWDFFYMYPKSFMFCSLSPRILKVKCQCFRVMLVLVVLRMMPATGFSRRSSHFKLLSVAFLQM